MAHRGIAWVAVTTFMVTVLFLSMAVSSLPIQSNKQCQEEVGANCSAHLRVERGMNKVCPTSRVPVPSNIKVCVMVLCLLYSCVYKMYYLS